MEQAPPDGREAIDIVSTGRCQACLSLRSHAASRSTKQETPANGEESEVVCDPNEGRDTANRGDSASPLFHVPARVYQASLVSQQQDSLDERIPRVSSTNKFYHYTSTHNFKYNSYYVYSNLVRTNRFIFLTENVFSFLISVYLEMVFTLKRSNIGLYSGFEYR